MRSGQWHWLAATPLGAAALPASSAVRPHTLVRIRGTVQSFAQDGSQLAWLTAAAPSGKCVKTLHVRSLVTRRTATTRKAGRFGSEDSPRLALAGRAVVWDLLTSGGNSELDLVLFTATAGDRRAHPLGGVHLVRDFGYPFAYPAVAGAGGMLAYSVPAGIRRVVHRRARRLFAFADTLALSVGDDRIAVVREELRPGDGCGARLLRPGHRMAGSPS